MTATMERYLGSPVNMVVLQAVHEGQSYAQRILLRNSARVGWVTEEARMVIDADGRNSLVVEIVKPPKYVFVPAGRAFYFAYFRDVPPTEPLTGRIIGRRTKEFFILPADSGLTVVAVEFPVGEFQAFKKDYNVNFHQALKSDERVTDFYSPQNVARVLAKMG